MKTSLVNVEDLGPVTTLHDAKLYKVINRGPYKLLPRTRPIEVWQFEVEISPGRWELVERNFRKWKHPKSVRTKFLSRWLGEELRPDMLTTPEALVGRTALVEVKTSIDSDGIMSRWVDAAAPNPRQFDSPGT